MKILIKNIEKVKQYLDNVNKNKLLKIDEAVQKSALFTEAKVKESIAGFSDELRSVDTGRFLNSVQTVRKGFADFEVLSGVEYAQYLEYGTSKISPRGHFRNTAIRHESEIKTFIGKSL